MNMRDAGLKCRGQLALSLSLLLSGFLSSVTMAANQRYIVTFKNSERYMAASLDVKKSKRLAELGLVGRSGSSQQVSFLNTEAKALTALDHVEMVIVESDRPEILQQLQAHPSVAAVEPEIFLKTPVPVNGFSTAGSEENLAGLNLTASCPTKMPWGISAVKADKAWVQTKGDQSRVMILDTGIDPNHPDLKSRFEKGRNFTAPVEVNQINQKESDEPVASGAPTSPDDVTDRIGHGTHVAGTIAADGSCLIGVAPQAKILMGKVCDESGCGSAAIIAGIDWGIAEHVQVISMSLGGALTTPAQKRAVDRAEQANVVVVAASGNDGVRRVSYPAAFPSVIAVGAVTQTSDGYKRADFSQYGPGLDIVAPGVDVISTVPLGFGRISTVTVDFGDGKATPVKSTSFAGALQNSEPMSRSLVYVGLGKVADVNGVDLKGKFALIQRGEITFREKVENAVKAGAEGVVIFNNVDGLGRGGLGGDVSVPVAMIEKAIGEQIRDLVAQGSSVSAAVVTEKSDYDAYDGTSMATPHVAGVVALVRSVNPALSAAQVRDILSQTSVNMGNADEYGSGLVNAEEAVLKASQTLPVLPVGLAVGF